MDELNLNEYKKREVDKITGVNPVYREILVTNSSGCETIEKVRAILKKPYKSISELDSDLAQLKSDVKDYILFDLFD